MNLELSSKYRVIKKRHVDDDSLHASSNVPNNGTRFLLIKNNSKCFVINESIYNLLYHFRSPNNTASLIERLDIKDAESKEKIESFVQQMKHRKILVKFKPTNIRMVKSTCAENPFKIGDSYKNYIIRKKLSERSDTNLFLIVDKNSKEKFILKALKRKYCQSSSMKENFSREFDIMKRLPYHDNIRKLTGFFKSSPCEAILEYVEGISIRKWLKVEHRNISIKIHLIKQIIYSYSHMHNHKIIHGDVHTSNFLIDNNNNLKLIDFGFALLEDEIGDSHIETGGIYGYISPEKASASSFNYIEGTPDFCSETYQIGILIYRIIFEELPYQSFTWKELRKNITSTSKIKLEKVFNSEKINSEFLELLSRCLEKKPSNRFKNAVELETEYRKIIKPADNNG